MTTPELLPLLGLALTMVVGAVAQRTTGMGFALLIAPFLVLALGPLEGILVTNAFGVVSSVVNLVLMWRDVDWPRAAVLAPMGIVGIVPGALAVRWLPEAPLAVAVAALILVALALTLLLRGRTLPRSRALAAAGGFTSGFLNVTAGAGGPGLVVYAPAGRTTCSPRPRSCSSSCSAPRRCSPRARCPPSQPPPGRCCWSPSRSASGSAQGSRRSSTRTWGCGS